MVIGSAKGQHDRHYCMYSTAAVAHSGNRGSVTKNLCHGESSWWPSTVMKDDKQLEIA